MESEANLKETFSRPLKGQVRHGDLTQGRLKQNYQNLCLSNAGLHSKTLYTVPKKGEEMRRENARGKRQEKGKEKRGNSYITTGREMCRQRQFGPLTP